MLKCNYCNKEFTTKTNLNTHIKSAKYCINNRPIENNDKKKYPCKHCGKSYTTNQMLNKHIPNCHQTEAYLKVIRLENILEQKEILIKELKSQIEQLQNNNQELALKAITKPTTINNNTKSDNHSITNTYNHLQPINLSHEHLYQVLDKNLKLEHIYQGQMGLANVVAKNLLTDETGKPLAFCNDKSRQVIKYKNLDGEIIKDSKAYNLVSSIAPVAEEIAIKRKREFENIHFHKEKKEEVVEELEEEYFGIEDSEDEDYQDFLQKINDIQSEKNEAKQQEKVENIIYDIKEKENWSEEKKNFYFSKLIKGITDYQIMNVNPTIFSKQLSMILPAEKLALLKEL